MSNNEHRLGVRHEELVAKARFYAGQILDGKLTPYDGATLIWRDCFQQTFAGDHTFDPFVYWQDEYEDAQSDERRLYCADVIRQCARELLGGAVVAFAPAESARSADPSRRSDAQRTHSRQRSREIEAAIRDVLMRHWDPIGVAHEPACADEYDDYIGGVYHLLTAGADEMRIAAHLSGVQTEMMGLPKSAAFLMDVARQLRKLDVSKG